MLKYVVVSGYSMTGKTVVTDILKEFKGYNVPIHTAEFNLLRIQGGLLDLCTALYDDWSPIRSDAAIRRFKNVVLRTGTVASIRDPKSLFISNGMNYDAFFNNRFLEISEKYIQSLIDYQYKIEWPYLSIDESPIKQFQTRLERILFKKKIFWRNVYGTVSKEFIPKTQIYLDSLFSELASESTIAFVMHNTVEPYNPIRGLNLFNNARIIIVQRDPRDVYSSNFVRNGAFVPDFEVNRHWNLKLGVTGAGNIDTFIQRQLAQFTKVNSEFDDDRVLRILFEDLVLDYELTLKKIYDFLDETPEIHIKKGEFFKPELSSRNIGLWKKMTDQTVISKIESALKPYCYYEK